MTASGEPKKVEKTAQMSLRDMERDQVAERRLIDAIRTMHEDELVDFIRDTVVRLDALADRLEVFATTSTKTTNREAGDAH